MKIDKNDLEIFRENPLELFYQGIKAKATRINILRFYARF